MDQSELPQAPVVRIAKEETGLRISEEAKIKLVVAAERFIQNVAKESSKHDFFDGRKTIQGRDIDYILNDKGYKRMIPNVGDVPDE